MTDIAKLLDELAELSSLSGENKFKAVTYRRAANTIRELDENALPNMKNLPKDLAEKELAKLPGVGPKIACKVKEMLDTGTCRKLEQLRQEHAHLLPLLGIHGIGPQTALKLYNQYKVTDLDGVKALIAKGVIKDKRIIDGISKCRDRMPLEVARAIAEPLVRTMGSTLGVIHVEACGSLRRCAETVGDIDIVVCVTEPQSDEFASPLSMARVAAKKLLDSVSEDGESKVSGTLKGVTVDFRFTTQQELGSMLLYFTGPRDYNKKMRSDAEKRGWLLNEHGLYDENRNRIAGGTEQSVCQVLGWPYLTPIMRSDSSRWGSKADLQDDELVNELEGAEEIQSKLER